MLQNKKGILVKATLLLILVVVIQSFLQSGNEVRSIIGTVMGYLSPFIYAVFLAIVIHPISNIFEIKLKMKRGLAIASAVILIFILFTALVMAMLPGITASVNEITVRAPEYEATLIEWSEKVMEFLRAKGVITLESGKLKSNIDAFLSGNSMNIFKTVSVNVMGMLITLGQILLGLLLAIFFINDREYFERLVFNTIFIASNRNNAEKTMELLDRSRKIFLNYLWGKALSSVGVGIIALVVMLVSGVPYSGLIAVLMTVGNMIPYIGGVVALGVGTVLVIIAAPVKIIYLLLAYFVSNQLEAIYISPKIIGKTVGLSSFWVITGVLLGGAVMGPIGMILGVPVVGVLKLLYGMRLEKKVKEQDEENPHQ